MVVQPSLKFAVLMGLFCASAQAAPTDSDLSNITFSDLSDPANRLAPVVDSDFPAQNIVDLLDQPLTSPALGLDKLSPPIFTTSTSSIAPMDHELLEIGNDGVTILEGWTDPVQSSSTEWLWATGDTGVIKEVPFWSFNPLSDTLNSEMVSAVSVIPLPGAMTAFGTLCVICLAGNIVRRNLRAR